MAIFAGARLGLELNLLPVIVGASLLLAACGTGGGGMQNLNLGPVFTSIPGTAATQDATYTYQIATVPSVGTVTLALASAPSGATLNGNTLTWTPSAAQSRIPDQFSVMATTAAGSVTQSWSVTPAGTISGTWVFTYWTRNGPVHVPFDFTKVAVPPMALVPLPNGSFQTVQGFGNSDGTFSIPDIPGGYYWLRPASAFYWTSSSTFDFGVDLNAQPPRSTGSVATTTLHFNFAGLDPLQAQDEVAFLAEPSPLPFVFPASSPAGATTFSAGALVSSNIDFSQIDMGFLLQYEPDTFGGLTALKLGPAVTLTNLTLSNGVANTIGGTLNHSPQASFDLNVKGSAWKALFDNIGPGPATLLGSDLVVIAQPFVSGNNLLASSGLGLSLLVDPQPGPIQSLSPKCVGSGPTVTGSFTLLLPGEPPVIADQDFGPVQYGDPFPSEWPRVFTFCQTASVAVPIPGSTSPVTFQLVDTRSTSLPTSPILPLISPVQNPTINGSSLFMANTVGATGVTLGWTAPSGSTPTGYKIATYVSGALRNGSLSYQPAGTFYTEKTSAMLPPLQAGQTYVFLISAILDGLANFETRPNRSALPTGSASVVSAPIAINTGP